MVNNSHQKVRPFSKENLDRIKEVLVDIILSTGTSIGFLAFVVSFIPFDPNLINADLVYDVIGISSLFFTYLFRKKLSVTFKTNIIIVMVTLIFVSDILENGLHTPDVVLVLIIPFLSILVYSLRTTLILYAFCLVLYLIIGYLFTTGVVTSVFYDGSQDSFVRWVETAIILSVVTFVITLVLNKFDKTIYRLFNQIQRKNDELMEREALLSTITKNIPRTFLTVIDKELIIRFTEGSEYEAFGLDPKDFYNVNALDTLKDFGDDVVDKIRNGYEQAFKGTPQNVNIVIAEQHLRYRILPLNIVDDVVQSLLIVTENVSDDVKTKKLIEENLEEKNVLLQEIHHRVKNNLAVVSGLLELQSYNIEDPKSKHILRKSTNRIMSIAKVHEMLYESKNFTKIPFKRYINELTDMIFDSLNLESSGIEIKTKIGIDQLNINHGVPLGIIFNELITNSVKYGFNGQNEKVIEINVQKEDDFYKVVYSDNGVGIENFEKATTKSLGFTLIHSLLSQIEAEYNYNTKNKFMLEFRFSADVVSN